MKRFSTEDREFLPAALEIVQTPPSPIAMSLLTFICLAFFGAIVWSYFSWIDVYAVAAGKIQPSGRSKVVQPFEAGKVRAIAVANGDTVNAGDVLIELDSTESTADRAAQQREFETTLGEMARRTLEIAIAKSATFKVQPIEFRDDIPDGVRQREAEVLAAEIGQLASAQSSLKAQLDEKLASKTRFEIGISAREKLLALAKERVDMRTEMDAKGAGSRALIIEAQQQYESLVVSDASDRGQLLEAIAAAKSIERKVEESLSAFVADQSQKLEEAKRKSDRLKQELVKAQSKSDRLTLRAPIAGTVQQLSVTTIGQVVAGGQSLLTIVPSHDTVEVEALIANRDVGFVQVGQKAIVKIEAFPFTRYGTIDATVTTLSKDAVDEKEAANLSDVATLTRPQGANYGQSLKTQNLAFPAIIRLQRDAISVDGKEIPLLPGMAVTVEIKTGQRRAIDFVLSPLREVASQASHER